MQSNRWNRTGVVGVHGDVGAALFKSGAWIVVGYLGASTFASGAARLLFGEGALLAGVTFVLAGGALAIYGWRRGYRILDRTRGAATPDIGQAYPADARSTSGLTTLIGAPDA